MTTIFKRVSLLLCVVLIAIFAIACNPTDNEEDSGGQTLPTISGTTLTATVDGEQIEGGGASSSITISVIQNVDLLLSAGDPTTGVPEGYDTIEREWFRSTTILSETGATYRPNVTEIGSFSIQVRVRYRQGDTDNYTEWARANANITVTEPELPAANAPTGVTLTHAETTASTLPIHLNKDQEAIIDLSHDIEDGASYEYRWTRDGGIVVGATSPIYTFRSDAHGATVVLGQVRVAASDTNSVSAWSNGTANITVYGVDILPEIPEVWIQAPQQFTASITPAVQDVEWVWSLQDINNNSDPDGFTIDQEGVLTLDPTNTPSHGTRIYVVATTVIEGVNMIGRNIVTVRDPDIDTTTPQVNNATLALVSGGVAGTDVVPGVNIAFEAYRDQELVLNVGYDELQPGENIEIMIDTNGEATEWLSDTQFVLMLSNVDNIIKVSVRSNMLINDEIAYSQIIELTAQVTIVDGELPEPGETPNAPTGVMLSWVSGGDEEFNATAGIAESINIVAYQNLPIVLRVSHDNLPDGVGLELTRVQYGTQNYDWQTELEFSATYNDYMVEIGQIRTLHANVRTYVVVDGNKINSDIVTVEALVEIQQLPLLDAPTNASVELTGLEYIEGWQTIQQYDTFDAVVTWDRIEGLEYEVFWSYEGSGQYGESVTYTARYLGIREIVVTVVAILLDDEGQTVNTSEIARVAIAINTTQNV